MDTRMRPGASSLVCSVSRGVVIELTFLPWHFMRLYVNGIATGNTWCQSNVSHFILLQDES